MTKVDRHQQVCAYLNKLYERKNSDYGDAFSKSFKEYGMVMPCIRLEDKLNRLKALTVHNREQLVLEETLRDTLEDLANYAIMTIIEMDIEDEVD